MAEYNSRVANHTVNRKKKPWIHPWNTKQFNDLYNRDERFFSIVVKGVIAYLNNHIKLYDKPINHFIFNTGSSYMYVESNGYEFNWNETSGEDTMYMELPRCIIQLDSINIPQEELSQPYARGNYERKDGDQIKGFNAEIRRIPIELGINLNYVFSNFNEGLIMIQELINEFVFQRYFNITYLGQIIQCSIEFDSTYNIELNKIDLAAADTTQRNLPIKLTINTSYPVINERTEISNGNIIAKFVGFITGSRYDNIEIFIDGVKSQKDDIYFDMRMYDFDGNNKIDDEELDLIKEFINRFDIDKDDEVTTKDINTITEIFYNNTYNVDFDILHKGNVDLQNLSIIKALFKILDINNDNIVNYFEIDEIIQNIGLFKRFDVDNDLKVDYKDLESIIGYIQEHDGLKYEDIYTKIIQFLNTNIKPISIDLYNYANDIIKTDIENFQIAIEYYLSNNNIEINDLSTLYKYIKELADFLKYDFNDDKIIDKKDIDYVIMIINDNIDHEISYYYASEIIIHMNDNTLSNESITDKVQLNPDTESNKELE